MIRTLRLHSAAVAAALYLAIPFPASAADSQPGEIKGMDVMGDKARSANDGWSQAPVPREESAAKDAPNPGGQSTAENRNRPVPSGDTPKQAGEDPQQPLDHRTPGPSGQNPASPSK